MYTVNVGNMSCFGQSDYCAFYILTENEISDNINFIDPQEKYSSISCVIVSSNEDVTNWLKINRAVKKSVIIVAPNIYCRSPNPELLKNNTKLGILACFSTPSTIESIAHFLKQAEFTDAIKQDIRGELFFKQAQGADRLEFYDMESNTKTVFNHLDDNLQWHEQTGVLDWGDQQLLPSGEISTLPVSVFGQNIDSQLNINGVITIQGVAVLHSGQVSYLDEDQKNIYDSLSAINTHPIYLTIQNGLIKNIDAQQKDHPAKIMLESLIAVDSRYRILIEIGFGINNNLELYPSNNAMNEVFGGDNGVVHFGFGLLPYTQYHMDFLCPNISVKKTNGDTIFGLVA
jgi:hypothetical protein